MGYCSLLYQTNGRSEWSGQTTLMMITMTVVWFYNLTEILFSRTDVYEISGVEILLQIWSLESINATKGTQTKH